MISFKKISDIKHYLASLGLPRQQIGFVPTMGALHEGHIALIRKARSDNKLVVCSIFVNPTQFNEPSDYEHYPKTLQEDTSKLIDAGCDLLFAPSVAEMYPDGTHNMEQYDFGYLENILEGKFRPGHFNGVGQVVNRLLNIVEPGKLYLGQKDYQQCMVIQKLLSLTGKDKDIKVIIVPTVREADGLALSSRNIRLTTPQRVTASLLYQCLVSIEAKQKVDSFEKVRKECEDLLLSKNIEPEYIALADAETLMPLEEYDHAKKMVVLIAARTGNVRLIDNLLLHS